MTPIEPVSLGISLLAIIAFITPFVYHSKKRKRQETSLRQQFFHAPQEYGLDLHQLEFWRGQYAIGLDESKKTLLYQNSASSREFVRIPLVKVSNIRILKASRFKRVGRNHYRSIKLSCQYLGRATEAGKKTE